MPPPPTPEVDFGAMPAPAEPQTNAVEQPAIEQPVISEEPVTPAQPIMPAEPVTQPEPQPLGEQPAMQDQVYNNTANDPGAFKIPGM